MGRQCWLLDSVARKNIHGTTRSYIGRFFWLIILSSLAGPVYAQRGGVLEEIVVTAQKREQNLQDVGIAINAFTGDQMQTLGVERSFDIAAYVPGVHISGNLAGQNTQFSIRGVTQNDFNDIIEAPNAVYLDEGYFAIAQAQTFAVFDIDRVEILKGPQGTLFGRNATGGLVQYFSRQPSFEEVEGYADVTFGLFDSDADAEHYKVEAAVGGPLADNVAARVALMYNQHDGYLNNDYPELAGVINGQSFFTGTGSDSPGPGAGADMGDDDTIALRGILSSNFSENVSFTISANYARSEVATGPYQSKPTIAEITTDPQTGAQVVTNVFDVAPDETRASIDASNGGIDGGSDQANSGVFGFPFGRPVPGGDFFGYIDPDGNDFDVTSGDFAFEDQGETETWGINGRFEWEWANGTQFTAITDFKDYSKLLFIDVDSAAVNQLANYAGVDAYSLTQEIRLNGETDRMRWVGGFYYLRIDSESDNGLKAPQNSLPVLFDPLFSSVPAFANGVDIGVQAELETDSFNLFGQVEFDLSSELTLIAGARVIQEEKDYFMRQGLFASDSVFAVNVGEPVFNIRTDFIGVPDFTDDTSETFWTGKLQLEWRPTDDLLLYGGVNRGVKAGSFNAPIPGGLGFPDSVLPYDEEVLVTLEGGFKRTLFGGTTRLNGAFFYYDYTDYQAFLFTGVAGVVVNADGDNYGAELELQTSPAEGFDFLLNVSWFDATVEEVPLLIGTTLPPRDVDPTYAPEFQAAGIARYEWPAFDGNMSVQADVSYSDEFFYNLRNFEADKFDSYTMVNARLGWISQEQTWEAALIVNNVTDERAGIQGFDIASLCGCNEISYRPPRWYGFNLRHNF